MRRASCIVTVASSFADQRSWVGGLQPTTDGMIRVKNRVVDSA
jgi:hypothetical protein